PHDQWPGRRHGCSPPARPRRGTRASATRRAAPADSCPCPTPGRRLSPNDRDAFGTTGDHASDLNGSGESRVWIGHDDHAEAHVEHAQHLLEWNTATLLQHREDGRYLPTTPVEFHGYGLRQDARQVTGNTAAGDVRHGLDVTEPGLKGAQVAWMG